MNKQKIIFSSYDDIRNPYYGGGGALAVHEVAKRLAKKFGVTVLTGNYPSAIKKEVIDGVQYARIGFSFAGPQLGQFLFHFTLAWNVLMRSFDVWIESFTPPISTSFLPLFTKKPVIGLVHMLSGEDMRRKYFLPFDWIEKVGLKVYRQCIVLSDIFEKKILAINKQIQVAIIPNGVDALALHSQEKTAEYILFFGRIEVDQKGLDLLLEAYSLAKEKIDIPLVIAGFGAESEMKKLNQLIEKLKLKERVKLFGKFRGNEEKKQLLQKALFCVVPSRFETFSIVALEAMASGTPLVAFDIDGLHWISGDAIIKISPFDTDLLAQKIVDLCDDADLRETLARKGREYADQYSWDKIVDQYEVVIAKVIKK